MCIEVNQTMCQVAVIVDGGSTRGCSPVIKQQEIFAEAYTHVKNCTELFVLHIDSGA